MSDLTEIRIHGRGGQGNVVAAYLLAAAAIHAGLNAQAFPAFGAERRGAPVAAFVRIRREAIRRRSEVAHPDLLVVQDAKLMQAPATLAGIDHGGILVNAEADDALPTIAGNTVVRIAASRLAEETIGRRVPNVALLAALIRLTDLLPLAALQTAIDERFEGAIATKNKLAAEKAYGLVEAGAWRGLVGKGGDHADRH